MIRSELVQLLASENPNLTLREVETIIDVFFDDVSEALANGSRVELRGFGVFATRFRKERNGRNPKTGSSVEVPKKRIPYFKAGKALREKLNV